MNKVVNIEMAGQVFWIDEDAYKVLQAYLKKIRSQLADEEDAEDIFKDIELRIAELFFGFNSDEKKAIAAAQLDDVINQVGFIDGEDIDTEYPRKSYLDQQNRILGGVCAGLAVRFGVPAFILRVVFIALTLVFGLGIVLYLIFWISLETNSNRNAGLAAQGKARTARRIAMYEAPKEGRLVQLQRIIFLPVSILGTLATVFGNHFKNRSRGYVLIFKNIIALALLIGVVFLCTGLFMFSQSRWFNLPVTWLLGAAVMYLIVLGLAVFVREFYLARPNFKINKALKFGAIIPVVMVTAGILFLNYTQSEHQTELVENSFALQGPQLNLKFNEQRQSEMHSRPVRFKIETGFANDNQLKLHMNYTGYGSDAKSAKDSIRAVDYFFTFEGNTLELDRFWSLREGALSRGQYIDVTIEIPQNIVVNSSMPLLINRDDRPYDYRLNYRLQEAGVYVSSDQYLHEFGDDFNHKLSSNERLVLEDKFCEEFFISESWRCTTNIQRSVFDNSRFDRAFQKDSEIIDQLREYLLPDRSLFVTNLAEMNELVAGLSIEYPVMNDLQEYIEHLLVIKSIPEPAPEPMAASTVSPDRTKCNFEKSTKILVRICLYNRISNIRSAMVKYLG